MQNSERLFFYRADIHFQKVRFNFLGTNEKAELGRVSHQRHTFSNIHSSQHGSLPTAVVCCHDHNVGQSHDQSNFITFYATVIKQTNG